MEKDLKFPRILEIDFIRCSLSKIFTILEHVSDKNKATDVYLSGVKEGKCIGEGNFGKVFVGEWDKIEVALKSFKQGLEEFEKETPTFQ